MISSEAYRILVNDENVGRAIIKVDGEEGELLILFVSPKAHSKCIGYAAWCEIENLNPEVKVWETVTSILKKETFISMLTDVDFI